MLAGLTLAKITASPFLLPAGVAALLVGAIIVKKRRDAAAAPNPDELGNTAAMTPDKQAVYENVLRSGDPQTMNAAADNFQKAGLPAQAAVIRARASLASASPQTKLALQSSYKLAMASKNKTGIIKVAGEFEKRGAYVAADALYKHAEGLP